MWLNNVLSKRKHRMPEIIGKFSAVTSSVPPLDAHIGYLRHLTNNRIAKEILRERHGMNAVDATKTSKLWAAHIGQALNFHRESRAAPVTIRPVLQYYCFLNLSVAAILAYRPLNHTQYRQHGVEDKTHALRALDLSSTVLQVKRGAVPLFHSIISDVPLYGKRFRFGQLAAGFHMFHHELQTRFGKIQQHYYVTDEVRNDCGVWSSVFSFSQPGDDARDPAPPKRLEAAMPLLLSDYTRRFTDDSTEYKSTASWSAEGTARKHHQANGIKLVNYGAHYVHCSYTGVAHTVYAWRGVSRTALLPTLSATLLLSFSLASVVRYRPMLLDTSMKSPVALLLETFIAEVDAVFVPALRNMLYREELAISAPNFV